MVASCCAFACTAREVRGGTRSFHRFPVDPIKCALWVRATKRKDFTPSAATRICSDHFSEDAFDCTKQSGFCKRRYLKSDAVPTIFNFPPRLQRKISSCCKLPVNCTLNEPIGDLEIKTEPEAIEDPPNCTPIVPPRKHLRYVGDCVYHEADDILELRRKLLFVLNAYETLKKQVKVLQQHKRRLKKH